METLGILHIARKLLIVESGDWSQKNGHKILFKNIGSMYICVPHVGVGIACNMGGIMIVKANNPVLAEFEKMWIFKSARKDLKSRKNSMQVFFRNNNRSEGIPSDFQPLLRKFRFLAIFTKTSYHFFLGHPVVL